MKLKSYYTDYIKTKALDLDLFHVVFQNLGFLMMKLKDLKNGLKIIIMEKCHIWKGILTKEWILPN